MTSGESQSFSTMLAMLSIDLRPPRGDDGGVRMGRPERVTEERRHREPVGERADGGGLEAGRHDAGATARPRTVR